MEEHIYSDKEGIRTLVELLVKKGVKHVVLSPGSRNAPLVISFARETRLEHFVILDERSAAFFALGMAQQSNLPVALVCTSGTALLNYAPAVAEAWYQRIPLVVISADRPKAWVDQDDSQTIRQEGVLAQVVKGSWTLLADLRNVEERWYVNRVVNDALNCALKGRKGPIHLNVPLSEPLYGVRRYMEPVRSISFVDRVKRLEKDVIADMAKEFRNSPRIMILAGFIAPDEKLRMSLRRLSWLSQVVVMTEDISNLDNDDYITTIDRALAFVPEGIQVDFVPDLLISFGGPLVSKQVKAFLRDAPPRLHWSIDNSEHPADAFKALTTQVNLEPRDFLYQLADALSLDVPVLPPVGARGVNWLPTSDYVERWRRIDKLAKISHDRYIAAAPWSDLKAFSILMPSLPVGSALQLSNGTPVRYAQLFEHPQVVRRDGNRGTSGIEGSTSVAVGASYVREGITTLITGDMSFLYDSNALWNPYLTPRLKIVVIKNGGGGIFRFIPGPAELPELEECFETAQEVNVRGFADIHHFAYFHADDENKLNAVLPDFWAEATHPAILEIETPRYENSRVLRDYFKMLGGKHTN